MKSPKDNTPVHHPGGFDVNVLSSIVINGDISKLSQEQKVGYYRHFCERLGLDPFSQPFKLLRLNGKEVLYCDRSGTQQLSKLYRVSHTIKARETVGSCYVVTAQASTPDGRVTESIGAVPVENLRGDNLCNAMMKAETKAKRRATLDLLGLGILDETEASIIPNAERKNLPPLTLNSTSGGNDPCKKRYSTTAEIIAVLEHVKSVQSAANLYYMNAEMVEADAGLKTSFTKKKIELTADSASANCDETVRP